MGLEVILTRMPYATHGLYLHLADSEMLSELDGKVGFLCNTAAARILALLICPHVLFNLKRTLLDHLRGHGQDGHVLDDLGWFGTQTFPNKVLCVCSVAVGVNMNHWRVLQDLVSHGLADTISSQDESRR